MTRMSAVLKEGEPIGSLPLTVENLDEAEFGGCVIQNAPCPNAGYLSVQGKTFVLSCRAHGGVVSPGQAQSCVMWRNSDH
jgi:hypothetical protein